ncbi:hypothetical protein ARMGADRAFT_1021573 [Armillaria gallica]|uniref:Uncharacterized protein n=1 Tax=Armillaria gallica TaxID=47427 RepID=A0A2H3C8F4_ARMGA|nr:hypothetical protein ARMGADRAFT_1021573 [Armillaria gallica]
MIEDYFCRHTLDHTSLNSLSQTVTHVFGLWIAHHSQIGGTYTSVMLLYALCSFQSFLTVASYSKNRHIRSTLLLLSNSSLEIRFF